MLVNVSHRAPRGHAAALVRILPGPCRWTDHAARFIAGDVLYVLSGELKMPGRRMVVAWLAAAALAGGVPAQAQTAQADSGGSKPTLFETRDLYWAAGFAAVTVAV